MPILTKEVEVIPSGKMISYYKSKGYDAKYHVPLLVKVEDLQKGSHAKIEVLCDMCNESKMTVTYDAYNRRIKESGSYVCKKCINNKRKQTIEKRYGVLNAAQSEIFKEKMRQTNLRKYGVENVMHVSEIKEKMQQVNLQKYGVLCTLHTPENKKKTSQSFYKNGTQKTSKQQCYINSLYQGILNFSVKYYNVDIFLPDSNLIIEYDGGGHMLNVVTGRETIEEFNQKEIIRNNIVKREGFKQMRIISQTDKLPSDQILLQMLNYTRNYFSQYPNHSWIEFNIDTSTVRSAEYKDGVYYNYGNLRTIKDVA